MNLTWSTGQAEQREHFRRFGQEVVAPGAAERDARHEFHRGAWKALAEEGFWWVGIPREIGGAGGTLWDFLANLEGLAQGADDSGFVLSVVAHAGLIHVLLEHGTDEQRHRVVPPLAGGALGATAATEPAGGSHVAAVATKAIPEAEDLWRLSGRKSHITNAPEADYLLIVGRMPELGKRDITLFLLDSQRPGVNLGSHEDLLGQRTSPTGPILLDDVPVSARDVVGPRGGGLATLYSFLAFDRLMYGIVVAAQLEAALPAAVARIHDRRAFGAPIAEHELIQDKLVTIRTTAESARFLAYAAADALVRGDERFSALASCAKLAASEGGVHSTCELMQIFGHAGYECSQPYERHVRDALAIRIAGGTTEMQKKNIFKDTVSRYARQEQS